MEWEQEPLAQDRLRIGLETYMDQGIRKAFWLEGPSPIEGTFLMDPEKRPRDNLRVHLATASDSGTPVPATITVTDQNVLVTIQETYGCES